MNLNTEGLNVVCTIGSPCEIRQVELNLVPTFIQSHGHRTDEWLHTSSWLIVRRSEPSSNTLIIQYLYFESEILLQVLNDHDQERKLNGKSLLGIKRSIDVVGWDICSHDFQNRWLNIWIGNSLNVAVSDLFIPNLEWLRPIWNNNSG